MSELAPAFTSDTTALVTGASSGIGRATALALTAAGVHVVACGRDQARLEETASGTSTSMTTIRAEFTEPASVDSLLHELPDRIDILVNAAGVFDSFTPIDATSDELWQRVIDVNLTVPMSLTRALLPSMLQHGSGVIVNVSSLAGVCGAAGGAAYTASKHALIGLTRHVAAIYAEHGIRCNAICPGGVATNLAEHAPPMPAAWVLERIREVSLVRTLRFADPDEIAHVAVFLASHRSKNINGAIITTDGGWTAI